MNTEEKRSLKKAIQNGEKLKSFEEEHPNCTIKTMLFCSMCHQPLELKFGEIYNDTPALYIEPCQSCFEQIMKERLRSLLSIK